MKFRTILNAKGLASKELMSSALATFIVRFFGIAMGFLLNIVIARILGVEGAGVFYLSITILMILSIVVRMGLDNAVMRFSSAAWERFQYGKVLGYYLSGVLIIVLIGLIVSLLLYFGADILAGKVFKNNSIAFALKSISYGVIPVALVFYHSGLLRGVRSPVRAGFVETFCTPFFFIIIILPLNALIHISPALTGYSYVLASTLSNLAAIYLFLRYIPVWEKIQKIDVREYVGAAYPMMWVASLGILITWFPTVYLGFSEDAVSVGLYHVAFRTANTIGFILVVINSIAAPRFAAYYRENKLDDVERIVLKCFLAVSILALPLLIIFITIPELVLLLFGQDFIEAANLLRIMSIGYYISVVTGSLRILMMMTGHEKVLRRITFVTALMSVLLNVVLIKYYGVIGAAYSISISLVFQNILTAIYVSKKLNIKVLPSPGYVYNLFRA